MTKKGTERDEPVVEPVERVSLPPRAYRVGNTYRDRGGTRQEGDQFLAWINIPGSGMGNSEGIRSLRYVTRLTPLPAYLILVTHEKTGGARNPWDDIVDYGSSEILYWGDAKAHETRRHSEFKGNKVLEAIHNELLDGNRQEIRPGVGPGARLAASGVGDVGGRCVGND